MLADQAFPLIAVFSARRPTNEMPAIKAATAMT
jgi:hypothetical protein